jgi:PAS domain S-box-containing protein
VSAPRDLTQRLAEAEATVKALLAGQIDAVLDSGHETPLLLAAAQAALRESETRNRNIIETANEGIFTIDVHSKITFVNRRVTEILGYAVEDMVGKSLFRFVSESAAVLSALRAQRSERGISEEYEVSFLRSDGTERWALLKTSPMQTGNKHSGTLVMMTDHTRDRRDRDELRTAEAHYRQIVELGPDGILKVDATGAILFANARFAEMVQVQPRDLDGASLHDHVAGTGETPLARLLTERAPTGGADVVLRRKDGVPLPVRIASSTIVTGDGSHVATLITVRPISQAP